MTSKKFTENKMNEKALNKQFHYYAEREIAHSIVNLSKLSAKPQFCDKNGITSRTFLNKMGIIYGDACLKTITKKETFISRLITRYYV